MTLGSDAQVERKKEMILVGRDAHRWKERKKEMILLGTDAQVKERKK